MQVWTTWHGHRAGTLGAQADIVLSPVVVRFGAEHLHGDTDLELALRRMHQDLHLASVTGDPSAHGWCRVGRSGHKENLSKSAVPWPDPVYDGTAGLRQSVIPRCEATGASPRARSRG